MKKLKIGIASSGRFHVLDLARELSNEGHDVKFYSYVPKKRAIKFGLPSDCYISLYPWVIIPMMLERKLGRQISLYFSSIVHKLLDIIVSWKLEKCDVLICMSGTYLQVPKKARNKYGAKIYIERGSRHILSQNEILSQIDESLAINSTTIERELAAYKLADKITIPSNQVRDSFIENDLPPNKLFQNPYGVNLDQFIPNANDNKKEYDVIFVGAWSLRKGADMLEKIIPKERSIRFLHVGPILDAQLPLHSPNFRHIDSVDQTELIRLYHNARILVLPSREEGLSLVQAQALACGLPIVCTERTGGEDLALLIDHPESVISVELDNQDSLSQGIKAALSISKELGVRDLLGSKGRERLTWKAYGKRYSAQLQQPE